MLEISPYIMAAGLGWVIAQTAKYIIYSLKLGRPAHYRQLYKSGRMPSAHSASTVALLAVVAGIDGVQSAMFGVTAMLAAIVLYDAMMVRRSSGEQGAALTELIKEQKSKVALPRVARGHTPAEVFFGALIGLVVGLITTIIYTGSFA